MDTSKLQTKKKIELCEVAARGIPVKPINPRHEVLNKLEAAGLFLTDNKFVDELSELIAAFNGKKTANPLREENQSLILKKVRF